MKRRAFLKLFIGTVAVATLPIPKFMAPALYIDDGTGFSINEACKPGDLDVSGHLTAEMIEEAALKSMHNMGRPDRLIMSEEHYETHKKYFANLGYQIVYV